MGLFTAYTKQTNEQLMVLVQNGDHRAFSHLYDRISGRLNAFFFKMLWNDPVMAEDYVHDLFAKLIDRPELYRQGYAVMPWLFQIASNMCKNAYRKREFEISYRRHLDKEGIQLSTIEQQIDERLQMDLLSAALAKMDEDQRTVFLLRYQQELTIKEIATIYGLPEGTIKSRLHYIRNRLAEQLNDNQNPIHNEDREI